ncbi:IS21 family transposase, partial [Succinatimonas hippei]|nr:IS21 family transposase [Succinatimonas hippei]
KWAKSIGNNTAQVIKRIFSSCDFEQQGYNPCLSVLRLSSKYGKSELERACEIALGKISTPRYKHINAIILEQQGKDSAAPLAN